MGELPLDGGGILGSMLSNAMAGSMGLVGFNADSIGVVSCWYNFIQRNVSWFSVIDGIGATVLFSYNWVRGKFTTLLENREVKKAGEEAKLQRQEVMTASKEKQAVREARGDSEVRIEPVVKKVEISERLDREKQIQLFDAPTDSELPGLRLLDPPKPHEKGFSNEASNKIVSLA